MRMTANRRREFVEKINTGEVSIHDVVEQVEGTLEEVNRWVELYSKHGYNALRATNVSRYR